MPFLAPFEIIAMEEGEQKGLKEGISIGEQRGISIGEQRGISIGEQRGISIGEQRGSLVEARNSLTDILEEEFGAIPSTLLESIQNIDDIDAMRRLRRLALKVSTLEEFSRHVSNEISNAGKPDISEQ